MIRIIADDTVGPMLAEKALQDREGIHLLWAQKQSKIYFCCSYSGTNSSAFTGAHRHLQQSLYPFFLKNISEI